MVALAKRKRAVISQRGTKKRVGETQREEEISQRAEIAPSRRRMGQGRGRKRRAVVVRAEEEGGSHWRRRQCRFLMWMCRRWWPRLR